MTVQEVMTADPETISPETSIRKAALMMRDDDIGVIPVVDHVGSLVGIVTDRDLVIHGIAEGHNGDTSVAGCMTHAPESVAQDATLEQAMLLMSQRQIRRLPIVENGRLVGIVSLGDLASSPVTEQEKAETLEKISANGESLRTPRPADLT